MSLKAHRCSGDPDCFGCKIKTISLGSVDPEAPGKHAFESEQRSMAADAGIEIERVSSGSEVNDKRDELAKLKKARDKFLTEMQS